MHANSPQTVALLFTDLVGSTELAGRLGPQRSERVRQDHFAVLREAIGRTGGGEVKSLGDGLMVVCPSAAAAVACAIAMQQGVDLQNRSASPPLSLRVGVAIGDAVHDEGDWYGTPAVEAARLCALAEGGQILVTAVVRMLTGAVDGPRYEPVGPLRLKGLPGPVTAWSLAWEALPPQSGRFALPPVLAAVARAGFVGRHGERRRLEAVWAEVVLGDRRLALVTGGAGIGKTHLAAQLARDAQRDGALVLYGRSGEDVGLPYEPWRQALDHAVAAGPSDVLERHVERHGGELLRLAPGLAARVEAVPEPRTTDAETERHLLFGAVLGLLEELARANPLLLVLDDLHWAGRPTIALLRQLQLAAGSIPLLVVATYRGGSAPAQRPLDHLLSELYRDSDVARVDVAGLDEREARALVSSAAGELDGAALALADRLHRDTGGNPFFMAEMVRHLTETGTLRRLADGRWTAAARAPEVPPSLTEVIMGRVARLGPDAEPVLRAGAATGRDFDAALVAQVARLPDDVVLDVLEAACAANLVAESVQHPGSYAFVHALVQDALEKRLMQNRREQLHRRLAEALEERRALTGDVSVGEIARHWDAAGPAARARALAATAEAGRAALAQLAPDEAMHWFRRGLEIHRELPDAGADDRCELLLGLGEAQVHAGAPDFRETLLEAADEAGRADDRDRVVRAALANTRGVFSSAGFVDDERVAMLEAALRETPPTDPRRPRLLALLAAELLWQPDHARRQALSDEAIALAREQGDPGALVHALRWRVTAVWWPQTLADRLDTTAELIALTQSLGDPLQRFWALSWRAVTLVQAADIDQADRQLDELRALLQRLHYPRLEFVLAADEAWRAQLGGRLADAEASAERCRVIGEEAAEPDAISLYVAQLGPLRWHQGRLGEEVDLLTPIAEGVPAVSVFRAMQAVAEIDAGHEDNARACVDALARARFETIPADPVQLGALTLWAEVAARVADRRAAALLVERLAPLRDQVVLDALGALGLVSRAAGLAAGALGRWSEADQHFEHALRGHERMRAASLAARTRLEWGSLLARRPETADRSRDLLGRAATDARTQGLHGIERRAVAALASPDAAPARGVSWN